MSEDDQVPIQSVQTSLELIETLVDLNGAGVSELARHLEMPKPTIHDHLKTLRSLGYVERDDAKRYYPTTRFLGIGGLQRNEIDLYQAAKSKMVELAEDTGEHAGVMIEENGLGVVLFTARGNQVVNLNMIAGMRTGLHTTGLGKAILAHLPQSRLEAILDQRGLHRMTENTICTREALFDELQQIRSQGVAYDREERLAGLRSVGVPVVSDNAEYPGSVGIFGPAQRFSDARIDELVPELKQVANVIEIDINYATG